MKNYTIYCTEEQTLKAERLGAPVKKTWKSGGHSDLDKYIYKKPTAEQMCGWLRGKGIIAQSDEYYSKGELSGYVAYMHPIYKPLKNGYSGVEYIVCKTDSYESGILAAIDAALDYLEKKGGK